MRLATREQIYKIDQKAREDFKLSTETLVQRAGKALAEEFLKVFRDQKWNSSTSVGVWCGPGHNGADGRVVAQVLKDNNLDAQVLTGTHWDPQDFKVILDAYFGVGLNRQIEGEVRAQIEKINLAEARVVAIDIASGLDANRGVILGVAVKADWTLTVHPAKPGLFLNDGAAVSGRIRSVSLDLPPALLQECANTVFLVGASAARRLLPARSATSNKTSFGHLLVVAGSPGMDGAAHLVTEAAARMGCGYVTICTLSPEASANLRSDFLRLSPTHFFQSDLKKYSAVVVGPGLGTGDVAAKVLRHLLKNHGKVLVDADALTLLSQHGPISLPAEWILTPHAGELSRLLKSPAPELEADRLKSVERAVQKLNAHILFKGFRTVLGTQTKTYIIGSGNVALAKAGSGDVLAGFIGSLMAQGLPTAEAGVLGAYLQGRIADDWLRRGHSNRTLLASDLAELLDATFRGLKKSP